jgi:hypothetical protein
MLNLPTWFSTQKCAVNQQVFDIKPHPRGTSQSSSPPLNLKMSFQKGNILLRHALGFLETVQLLLISCRCGCSVKGLQGSLIAAREREERTAGVGRRT